MILNRQRTVRVKKESLELFLRRVRSLMGLGEAEVTVCLVSDARIAAMNRAFRKKTGPTDVLSFPSMKHRKPLQLPLKRSSFPGVESLGDIAISPATARRYAKKNGRALPNELFVLILHGVLHLLGYDHETDRGEMNRVECKLRKQLGLA